MAPPRAATVVARATRSYEVHKVTKVFELGQIRVRALRNVSLRIDSR